jgi:hypothetical protein
MGGVISWLVNRRSPLAFIFAPGPIVVKAAGAMRRSPHGSVELNMRSISTRSNWQPKQEQRNNQ